MAQENKVACVCERESDWMSERTKRTTWLWNWNGFLDILSTVANVILVLYNGFVSSDVPLVHNSANCITFVNYNFESNLCAVSLSLEYFLPLLPLLLCALLCFALLLFMRICVYECNNVLIFFCRAYYYVIMEMIFVHS